MTYFQRQHHVIRRRATYRRATSPAPTPTPAVVVTQDHVGGAIRRRRRRLVQRASVKANQIAKATAEAVRASTARHAKARQHAAHAADSAEHAALIEGLARDVDRAVAAASEAATALVHAADDFARVQEKLRADARRAREARQAREAQARVAAEAQRLAAEVAHAAAVRADDEMAMMALAIIDLIECEEVMS